MNELERKETTLRTICEWWSTNHSWDELAELIIGLAKEMSRASRERLLSLSELEQLAPFLLLAHVEILQELRAGDYYQYRIGKNIYRRHMRRIGAAFEDFKAEFRDRAVAESARARFAEAQLASRFVSGAGSQPQGYPSFASLPDWDAVAKSSGSSFLTDYMIRDLGLRPPEHEFDARPGLLELVQILIRTKAEPATLENPKSWLLVGLARGAERRDLLHVQRWGQLEPEQAASLFDPRRLEPQLITQIDLVRGLADVGLSSDQAAAVQAQFEGAGLRDSKTADALGWSMNRLEKTRRSLGPDRPIGKTLRNRLKDYRPKADGAPRRLNN